MQTRLGYYGASTGNLKKNSKYNNTVTTPWSRKLGDKLQFFYIYLLFVTRINRWMGNSDNSWTVTGAKRLNRDKIQSWDMKDDWL